MKLINIVALVLGGLMLTGVVKSSPTDPCKTNDKLLEMMGQMLADSKKDADNAKKNYESRLAELERTPCKVK